MIRELEHLTWSGRRAWVRFSGETMRREGVIVHVDGTFQGGGSIHVIIRPDETPDAVVSVSSRHRGKTWDLL